MLKKMYISTKIYCKIMIDEKPKFNAISEYATVQDYLDILNSVKDKDKFLIVRTKFIKDTSQDFIDASNPNISINVFNNYCVIELLPI